MPALLTREGPYHEHVAHRDGFRPTATVPAGNPPLPPRMDECPSGGAHAWIPNQGGGGRVCVKCNAQG